jgi:large subunit ribosomal protein L17
MRHHKAHRKLHREKGQRTALLKSLARSLVLHESIVTTIAKAKELRPFVEKLITTTKDSSLASARLAEIRLTSPEAIKKLRTELATRYAKRAGGYTRIIRMGRVGKRVGESARIELVK